MMKNACADGFLTVREVVMDMQLLGGMGFTSYLNYVCGIRKGVKKIVIDPETESYGRRVSRVKLDNLPNVPGWRDGDA
ncbi:MAG: hypothetical protein KGZ75_07885 [Syntrophomonadaceae bacterium]|nr:hypothetical protein [Syntrophomonadaceae bacterium]